MPANTFTSWQHLPPMGIQTGGVPGSARNTFPIDSGPEPWFRDRLDAARSARIPSAEYPDGYLGNVDRKREGRVAHSGTPNTRSYHRGIHVGARVRPDAYFWDDTVSPQMGLELQARGKKFAPTGELATHLVNDGKPGPVQGSQSLGRLTPRWR